MNIAVNSGIKPSNFTLSSLDLLCLLRSQHKMARLLLVGLVALCVASTKAAVIPVEELVDGLQSFLTAPEESGLRLKRSTGEWDKEFDLSSMGMTAALVEATQRATRPTSSKRAILCCDLSRLG